MSNSAVQAQWSLNQTAGSVVSMTMGTLAALTSDNVQPVAYLACEKFGATLAICVDTVRKVEAAVVPSRPPAAVEFLKAYVGFFSNDCATRLGESKAGVRFLALATALVSTVSLFEAASVVDLMLRASTSDLTLLPSTRHLKDLLMSLEPRCHRAGFADEVLGWQILLQQTALPLIELEPGHGTDRKAMAVVLLETGPSPEMVYRLVDAFRQLTGVGPSAVTGVTVRSSTAVPWVIAFTKWCLGAPPRVSFDGQRSEDILPSESPVTLLIPGSARDVGPETGLHVAIHYDIDRPTELVAQSTESHWRGMVSIRSYGELLLQKLGFESDLQHHVLHEALGCAIPQCLELLNFSCFVPFSGDASAAASLHLPSFFRTLDRSLGHYRLRPLPNTRKIAAVYETLFGLPRIADFGTADTARLVGDYPLVKLYLGELQSRCSCSDCDAGYDAKPSVNPFIGSICECKRFYNRLSHAAAVVLVLSLFDSACDDESPLQLSTHSIARMSDDLRDLTTRAIYKVLRNGHGIETEVSHLHVLARHMVGHEDMDTEDDAIITSAKGQVVYPTLFETQYVEREGYMALSCLSGVLRHGKEVYTRAVSSSRSASTFRASDPFRLEDAPPVLTPANLFPHLESYWEITELDVDFLGCMLMVRSKTDPLVFWRMMPQCALFGLRNGLLLEACHHEAGAALPQPDQSASYLRSFQDDPAVDASLAGGRVGVMAVHRADNLRLASVISMYNRPSRFFVLRAGACLACCLKLCRMADIKYLIL